MASLPVADPEGTQPDRLRSPAKPIRVLIVDDHALFREGTAQLLEREPDIKVVGQAATAAHALQLMERLDLDLALVDVGLPGINGLELARQIHQRRPRVRVVILSAYDDYAYISQAMEIGVEGYLLKTSSGKELVEALRAVAEGAFVLGKAVSQRLMHRRSDQVGEPGGTLTPRELGVLDLVARGSSNKQIASELGLGIRTIEGYVSNILSKLNVASRTEAAMYAFKHHLVTLNDHGEAT